MDRCPNSSTKDRSMIAVVVTILFLPPSTCACAIFTTMANRFRPSSRWTMIDASPTVATAATAASPTPSNAGGSGHGTPFRSGATRDRGSRTVPTSVPNSTITAVLPGQPCRQLSRTRCPAFCSGPVRRASASFSLPLIPTETHCTPCHQTVQLPSTTCVVPSLLAFAASTCRVWPDLT